MYDPNNIFAKILRGEIPCVKVYEDSDTLAFMDVMPESRGHVLVVPKEAAEDILDLSPGGMSAMMATVQKIAKAVDKALAPDGILLKQYNRAPAGQSIFHVHFHVLPRYEGSKSGAGVAVPDTGWPAAPALGEAVTLTPAEIADLRLWLQGLWPDPQAVARAA